MNFLLTFVILSIVNVVFSTIRTLTTVKSGKGIASLIAGGYFAYYNVVIIYTVADFPLWQKCLITFICNVVGVYLVKWGEEKTRKDKLWKVEVTIPTKYAIEADVALKNVPHSYQIITSKHTLFSCYCNTQEQSKHVKETMDKYGAKYFASESKTF